MVYIGCVYVDDFWDVELIRKEVVGQRATKGIAALQRNLWLYATIVLITTNI
jgi:hypothetical protein